MRALSGIPAPQAAVAAAKIALSLGGNSILCAGYLLKKGDGKKGVRRISSSFPPNHLTPTVIDGPTVTDTLCTVRKKRV